MENDHLLSRLAQPNDLWFHVLGQGGAHVLIRIPSSKQEPPQTTIQEAAQIAARLSKAAHGAKVRVVYTQCKHVRKVAKDKPGLVRYENEKTVEVDTAKPMPKAMKQLFGN
jgi:predicted ribosome quality control (RQC) complex YloA/Tae2 family protein